MVLVPIVNTMRSEAKRKKKLQEDLQKDKNPHWKKESFCGPNSIVSEKFIKNNLQIGPPLNEISTDGYKNGINYEIKTSIHSKFHSNPPRSFYWL